MTPILTNIADLYLDLYSIAYELQRPLTPERLHTASQAHHDMMARREIKTLTENELSLADSDPGDLCLMKKLVTTFVETYVGEAEADWPVPISKKTADGCVDFFHDLQFEDLWPEDNDDAPTASQPPKNNPTFEDRMRRHVQHFVESYIGEPQTTPLGQQEVLDIIGYFEDLVWKSYQVRFDDDADKA